jgi:hypothetical protein
MRRLVIISLLLMICLAACARRDQRNANCQWQQETPVSLDLRNPEQQRHLNDDALLAEDHAIRYADSNNWRVPGQYIGNDAYGQARDKCMEALFSTIAKNHGVTLEQVREAVGRRSIRFDAAVLLFFAAFYFLLAYWLAQRVCRRFPFHEGWHAALITTVGASILVSFAGLLMLETFAVQTEIYRVGSDHLSYRAFRIPWAHNREALFAGGLFLFWLAAALHHRAASRNAETSADQTFSNEATIGR